jgi:UDP-glucose 4-epimerase
MEQFSLSLKGFSVINGASGASHSNREIVTRLACLFRIDPGQLRFDGIVRQGDPLHCHANISGAMALGWRPSKTLETGLAEYVRWFQDENAC